MAILPLFAYDSGVKASMFMGTALSLGSADCKNLSLKEELIAEAMGADCKLRGLQSAPTEGVLAS